MTPKSSWKSRPWIHELPINPASGDWVGVALWESQIWAFGSNTCRNTYASFNHLASGTVSKAAKPWNLASDGSDVVTGHKSITHWQKLMTSKRIKYKTCQIFPALLFATMSPNRHPGGVQNWWWTPIQLEASYISWGEKAEDCHHRGQCMLSALALNYTRQEIGSSWVH